MKKRKTKGNDPEYVGYLNTVKRVYKDNKDNLNYNQFDNDMKYIWDYLKYKQDNIKKGMSKRKK